MYEEKHDLSNKLNENFTKENQNQDNMFLACNVAQEKQKDVWFLDLGCSKDMRGNIEMFSNLNESVKSEGTIGTNNKVSVMGKGKVIILTKKGENKYLSNIYFVPGLKHNLISIGQLMQKDYHIFFKNGECIIVDKFLSKQPIGKVKMTSITMFPLKIKLDLKEEDTQAQLSMDLQDERKVDVVTQTNFQVEVKDEN